MSLRCRLILHSTSQVALAIRSVAPATLAPLLQLLAMASAALQFMLGDLETSDLVLTTPLYAFYCHRSVVAAFSPVLAECILLRETCGFRRESKLEVPLPDFTLVYKLSTYSSLLLMPYTGEVSTVNFTSVGDFADLHDLAQSLLVSPMAQVSISYSLYNYELSSPQTADRCWDIMLSSILFREHGQLPMATALLSNFAAVFDPSRHIPLPERLRFTVCSFDEVFWLFMQFTGAVVAGHKPLAVSVEECGAQRLMRRVHRSQLVAETILRTTSATDLPGERKRPRAFANSAPVRLQYVPETETSTSSEDECSSTSSDDSAPCGEAGCRCQMAPQPGSYFIEQRTKRPKPDTSSSLSES